MKEIAKHRVITMLDRHEVEFLDKLGKDALFTTGHKLSYNDILKGLLDFAITVGLNGENIRSLEDFRKRLLSLSAQHMGMDRRKYPRIQRCLNVNFRPLESLQEFAETNTENLSIEGLCIDICSSANPPQVNQPIEIMIDDKQHEPIKAIGKAAWVKEKEGGQGMSIGVKLTYLKKEDRERFMTCLEEYAKKEVHNETLTPKT